MSEYNDLDLLLGSYDDRADAFRYLELSQAIATFTKQHRDPDQCLPAHLREEQIAFDLIPEYRREGGGWGTYYGPTIEFAGATYPDIAAINSDTIEYWAGRARASKHPLLRVRYGDAAWDLSHRCAPKRCAHDIPRIMIDASLDLIRRHLAPHAVDGIRFLRRALEVAILLNDTERVQRVRDAIIEFEDQVAVDEFLGLWGFSFDMLLRDKRKIPLRDEQRNKIIADLEARLARLTAPDDPSKLEITHVEAAALRLGGHYRRNNRNEEVRRVGVALASACVRKATGSHWPAAAAWLERIHDILLSLNLGEEAKGLQPHYRDAARALCDSMIPVQVSVPVEASALEAFVAGFLTGDTEQILGTVVGHFLPRREEEQRRLDDIMKGRVIFDIFGSSLVDHTGRTISRVGSLGADPEGNLIHHVANMMNYGSFFLRSVIDRLLTAKKIDVASVMGYLKRSEILDADRLPMIERALAAYFAQDWLVAIHVLVPQIEHMIRHFIEMTGGATVKKGRNDGLNLVNLDELLRDERIEHVYGANGSFYLRVLLTDQRGWNIRNDVAHGITHAARSMHEAPTGYSTLS